jgi:hypothetical protein
MADETYKIIQMYNSTGVEVFPKTMAEIVKYGDTTVKAKIEALEGTLGELGNKIHMNVKVAPTGWDPATATAGKDDLGTIILFPNASAAAGEYIEYIAVQTGTDPDTYAWEQIGTTAVDLTGYATEDFVNTAISNKVAELNLSQYATVAALNVVDKKADDNAAAIKAINESAVMTSGITAELVGKITANESAIGTINSSAVMTSGITADKVGAYDAYVAVERYSKTEADAMAEGKASAAITALDLPNTYAGKTATEDAIKAINESAVMTSGITSDKVGAYDAYVAVERYSKSEADAAFAGKEATEAHIANGDIHVDADQVAAIADVANKADKVVTANGKTLSVLYFEEVLP